MTVLVEAIFNGLSNSSILILAAIGLAITFGVMRVINMAHGEMLMLGAYTGYVVTNPNGWPELINGVSRVLGVRELCAAIGIPYHVPPEGVALGIYAAIPIAFLVVGLVGFLLETCLIRHLYDRPLDTLLATWGVGLVLQQATRLVFQADLTPLHPPDELSGTWIVPLTSATIPVFRLFIIGFTILCLYLVYLWYFHTSFGLKIRAVTQNRSMAAALGISTRWVDSLTFAFGTGLAGVAGCIVGHLYNVKPDMGADYIVDAFMVVILGGMGHLPGTVLAGLIIGTGISIGEKLFNNALWPNVLTQWFPSWFPQFFPVWITEVNQTMAKVAMLLIVIGFIMIRPSGLIVTRERVYD
ncbi:MAG: hypothetical protein KatS3mg105_0265 [Gemmatales bacterium]|nr:MAG: hypothetical protein KatS3mg105_0265 [Gemmatales bacterium]